MANIVIQTVSNSSIHGLPNIIKSKSIISKLVWAMFFCISFVSCGYLINKKVKEYYTYPIISNMNKITEINKDFPAVTLCSTPYRPVCYFNKIGCKFIAISPGCSTFNIGYDRFYNNLTGEYTRVHVDSVQQMKNEKSYGLRLSMSQSNTNAYYRLYIHRYGEQKNIGKDIILKPQMEYDIVIHRTFLKKLSKPYSNCKKQVVSINSGRTNNSVKETQIHQYSQSECFYSCFYTAVLKACNYNFDFSEIDNYKLTNILSFFNIFD